MKNPIRSIKEFAENHYYGFKKCPECDQVFGPNPDIDCMYCDNTGLMPVNKIFGGKLETPINFVKDVVIATKDHIINFVKGFYHHFESVTLLTFSALGVSALLAEIPFYVTLPMWIESTLFIPILSIVFVLLIVKLAEYRANRRGVQQFAENEEIHNLAMA